MLWQLLLCWRRRCLLDAARQCGCIQAGLQVRHLLQRRTQGVVLRLQRRTKHGHILGQGVRASLGR